MKKAAFLDPTCHDSNSLLITGVLCHAKVTWMTVRQCAGMPSRNKFMMALRVEFTADCGAEALTCAHVHTVAGLCLRVYKQERMIAAEIHTDNKPHTDNMHLF